jgi:hypothetical protein
MSKRNRGEVRNGAFAYNCWLDSPVWQQKRPTNGLMDFGDDATIGVSLKRDCLNFHELELGMDFGMYLGKHNDKWVVGISTWKATSLSMQKFSTACLNYNKFGDSTNE